MSLPLPPKPAKLVIGLILKDKALLSSVASELNAQFGEIDMASPWFPFDFTTYYTPEMGSPLFRRMLAFQTLIEQNGLVEIKLATNTIERSYASGGASGDKRRINLDPGYLLYERFVLATGKNYAHRIYLDQGIYADLTLVYKRGAFETLPWTYPDYAHHHILSFLERIRKKYGFDLKQAGL